MKTKLTFILLICVFILSGCGFWGVRGNGKIITEDRNISEFTKLEVGGAYSIKVICGKEASLTISAEENLLPLIRTSVKGNALKIDTKRNISPRKEIVIEITVNELQSLECSGANNINVERINAQDFDVELSGAGNIDLKGETEILHAEISGAGHIDSRELKAKDVYISVCGAANASVYASNFLDASVSGVGSIDYYGNPRNTKTNVSGIGSIIRK